MIMATEADTSRSKNATHSFQHHHRLHHPLMFYPTDVTSSSLHMQRRGSRHPGDNGNDSADKLISVDEFDDSDDDSYSTTSPTPSDHALSGSFSRHYSPSSGGTDSNHKLRRKGGMTSKVLDEQELQRLRLKINSRERKRMHDLNSALDGLREVMPYAHGPSVRKLSKIATLLLARNYIVMLNSSLEEMKKLVTDIYHSPVSSRRASSQRSSAPSSGIESCAGGGVESNACSNKSGTSLHDQSTAPTCKASHSLPAFAHPTTSHLSPLPAHQPASLMLPLPALRASLSGLTPHDITALTSAYALPKCDGGSAHGISQTFPGQVHLLHRLPAPCSCTQCLSGASHFQPNLQLSRFSDPLFTTSAFLHRKN